MRKKLKLFVVGECSPDPNTWSIWTEYSLVIAESEDQARELANGYKVQPVCEIPLNKAVLLCRNYEPDWGDDL